MSAEGAAADAGPPTILNVGSGPHGTTRLPAFFSSWSLVRMDIDPDVKPDMIGSATDLSAIGDETIGAVWASHCLEHLFAHEVPTALAEFRRVLRVDGFLCAIVPDLQTVARYFVGDQAHSPIYNSAAGPVTPHDIFFGYGPEIAEGRLAMAHKSGFTPGIIESVFRNSGFEEVVIRRRANLELAVVATKAVVLSAEQRARLLSDLEL